MFVLRKMRRLSPDIVKGCSSIDGRVYAWVGRPQAGSAAPNMGISINTYDQLKNFSSEYMLKPIHEFITEWPH